jgi:pimeloyl-ACP methyl ester carboxylesterase
MAHRLGLLQEYDIEGRVADLRIPTLVLSGDQDVVVSTEEARKLARRIPHARFQSVRDAGHLAFVTDALELANRIRRFHQTARRAWR